MQKQFKSLVGEVRVDYQIREVPKVKIRSSKSAFEELRPLFKRVNYKEEAFMLLLNRVNNTLGWVKISEGGITSTVLDVKIILQHALLAHASNIVLAHNHPSGNLKPSRQDILITKNIRQGCKMLDIDLLDHLIITESGYYSLSDHGE